MYIYIYIYISSLRVKVCRFCVSYKNCILSEIPWRKHESMSPYNYATCVTQTRLLNHWITKAVPHNRPSDLVRKTGISAADTAFLTPIRFTVSLSLTHTHARTHTHTTRYVTDWHVDAVRLLVSWYENWKSGLLIMEQNGNMCTEIRTSYPYLTWYFCYFCSLGKGDWISTTVPDNTILYWIKYMHSECINLFRVLRITECVVSPYKVCCINS